MSRKIVRQKIRDSKRKRLIVVSFFIFTILFFGALQNASARPILPEPPGTGTFRAYGYVKDSLTNAYVVGATIKIYEEAYLRGTTSTNVNGYFSIYVSGSGYSDWLAKVTKTGYVTTWKGGVVNQDTRTINMGTTFLTASSIQYTIHGSVKDITTANEIANAPVEIFRDSFGAWEKIGDTSTSTDGTFSFSYTTTTALTQVRATSNPDGYQSGAATVGVQGTYVDVGAIRVLPDGFELIDYSVSGKVIDVEQMLQIDGAEVTISAFYYGTWNDVGTVTTTASGTFSFYKASYYIWDAVKVTASKSGYDTGSRISLDCENGEFYLDGTYGHPWVELNSPIDQYTLIVAIDDYANTGEKDLAAASTDANQWISFLADPFYPHDWSQDDILVYGDIHPASYTKYTGVANEANVKEALREMMTEADQNDLVSFIVSAHGGPGPAYGDGGIGLYDYYVDKPADGYGYNIDEDTGMLWDWELAGLLQYCISDRIFLFLSTCYSGAFIDDVQDLPNSNHFFVVTACGPDGVGVMTTGGSWLVIDFVMSTLMNDEDYTFYADPAADMEAVFTTSLLQRDWTEWEECMKFQSFCGYEGMFTLEVPSD